MPKLVRLLSKSRDHQDSVQSREDEAFEIFVTCGTPPVRCSNLRVHKAQHYSQCPVSSGCRAGPFTKRMVWDASKNESLRACVIRLFRLDDEARTIPSDCPLGLYIVTPCIRRVPGLSLVSGAELVKGSEQLHPGCIIEVPDPAYT